MLIVDHYGIDEDWQQELKAYYDKLMVIDDLADRKHQCDILLDQTFGDDLQDLARTAIEAQDNEIALRSGSRRPKIVSIEQV